MLATGVTEVVLISLAYLLGSIPTALVVCNSMGIADPRQQGSGNPGATNVLRIGNRVAALLTLLGDIAKGAVVVLAARWLEQPSLILGFCALAAVLGHLYPLFGAYRGGKGVATTLGCTLALSWPVMLIQAGVWTLVFLLSRTSSLASLIMALSTPLAAWYFAPELLSALVLISLLMIARHRSNIERLLHGREKPF